MARATIASTIVKATPDWYVDSLRQTLTENRLIQQSTIAPAFTRKLSRCAGSLANTPSLQQRPRRRGAVMGKRAGSRRVLTPRDGVPMRDQGTGD